MVDVAGAGSTVSARLLYLDGPSGRVLVAAAPENLLEVHKKLYTLRDDVLPYKTAFPFLPKDIFPLSLLSLI